MAFTYDPNMTEEQRQQAAQQSSGQAGAPVAGGPQAADAPAAKSTNSTGGTQSGQFTNLQQYLGANANQQFGSQVAGKVQGDVDTANQKQQQAGNEFRTQAQAGTVDYDEQLANRAKTNASEIYNDENQRNNFTKMRDARYAGPNQLTDVADAYTGAQGANQNAQKAAQATTSEEGQKALLGQYYGRPTYSRGETNLDQFLVQNDQSARPKFQQTREQAGQLEGNFQTLQQQLAAEGQQAAQKTEATKQRVAQEFLGDQGAIAQQKAAYEKRAADENARIQAQRGDVAGGKAPVDALKGLTTYGQDLNQFLTAQEADAAGMLSEQEAGNYRDLNALLNQQSQLDLGKAGSYKGGLQLDQDKYNQFKNEQESYYNSLFAPTGYSTIEDPNSTVSIGGANDGKTFKDQRIIDAFRESGLLSGGVGPNFGISQYQLGQAKNYASDQYNDADIAALTNNKYNKQQYQQLMALLNEKLGRNSKLG